jgi:hypothetical protein
MYMPAWLEIRKQLRELGKQRVVGIARLYVWTLNLLRFYPERFLLGRSTDKEST